MSKTLLALFASLVLLAGLGWLMMISEHRARSSSGTTSGVSGDGSSARELMFFCAASNRAVMEDIREAYERETGRSVSIQYGPSQTLLSQLEVTESGDLYLPADDSFLEMGREKGLIEEVIPLARMQCVVAVEKGNPKDIKDFDDLVADDVRLVQANPDATAVGKLTRKTLQNSGLWDRLDRATDAYRTTVNDVANDLLVGAADAAIVYDAVLHPYPDLDYVEIEELAPVNSQVSIGVLASTRRPAAALHFARYAAARDRGLKNYRSHGFRLVEGDPWADSPELTIFAGSMLRPAIEETIVAFEKREGVQVSRAYNGCGILVAQMKGGQRPDAYFACDVEFMQQVSDHFPNPVAVSENELVIVVQKGNPKNIGSLRDLNQPGLRVGVGHEKQCAMGWITQNVLTESGLKSQVMSNVTVQTPTGDMLVNQMLTGSLDAAIVYLSNAAGAGDKLDAVQIQGIPCSVATQPWAVADESLYPQLAGRLFEHICSLESQKMFAAEGFRWQKEQR
jgi:molybdate transport system substrate-binding protein